MADSDSLREVGEHPFLARLCARLRDRVSGSARSADLLIGPGDDCAVIGRSLRPLAITTDALVEGVHFQPDWLEASELGRRAITVNLSDLAAVGARPAFTLLAAIVPADFSASRLDAILDASAEASERAGALLIGGNLTRGPSLALTVTALGWLEGPSLSRNGAVPGDRLVVSGTLGGAAAAVADLRLGVEPPPDLRERYVNPVARIEVGIRLASQGAHAAIDLSDGLLADLGHLCRASQVGAVIERECLPRLPEVAARDRAGADFALEGGEDYELLVACPPELTERLDELSRETGVPLTVIGRCIEAADGTADGINVLGTGGAPHRMSGARGYDHFRAGQRDPVR